VSGEPIFDLMSRDQLSRRRGRLLVRIRRKYQTITEALHFGPLRLDFTRVADPDVVLDRIVVEEDRREKLSGQRRDGNDLHLPYWAELWDSAFGIGLFLVKNPPSGSVLDLGCGMGLAGMVAAAMGARVVLADLEADALLFAKLNTLPYSNRVRMRKLNWQVDRLDERFDLILGADVLYDRAQWPFLEDFWKSHLKNDGTVLLAEPGRQSGDMFIEWIAQRGWLLERFEQRVESRGKKIRLFSLAQKNTDNPSMPCESGLIKPF
jgi:predicted nicotinamide N-methyase